MLSQQKPSGQGYAPTLSDEYFQLLTNQAIYNAVASAGTTDTLTAQQIMGGIYVRSGGSTSTTTTDTAANIIAAMGPNAFVGQTALLFYVNTNSATTTLAAGTGVTLLGTTTALTTATRVYLFTATNVTAGAQAVTVQGCFAFTASTV